MTKFFVSFKASSPEGKVIKMHAVINSASAEAARESVIVSMLGNGLKVVKFYRIEEYDATKANVQNETPAPAKQKIVAARPSAVQWFPSIKMFLAISM